MRAPLTSMFQSVLSLKPWRGSARVMLLLAIVYFAVDSPTLGQCPCSISGRVTDGAVGVSNVTITAGSQTTVTGTDGSFTLVNLEEGGYSLTPSRTNTSFRPPVLNVTLPPATGGIVSSNQNFVLVFSIGGRVTEGTQGTKGIGGIIMAISPDQGQTATTGADGSYSFDSLFPGTYQVTPSRTDYKFNPTNRTVRVGPTQPNIDFSAFPPFTVQGQILSGTNPVSGATVIAANAEVRLTTHTDAGGGFAFSNLVSGDYTLTPSLAGYAFEPPSWLASGPTNIVFGTTPSALGGRITEGTTGAEGVIVTAAGGTSTNTTMTDAGGYYAFGGLAGTYTITPSQPGQFFQPARRVLSIEPGLANVNFQRGPGADATAVTTCDGPSLILAVGNGGMITIDCSGTITLDAEMIVATDTILDGTGRLVTISGGDVVALFTVDPGADLTLKSMTLAHGMHAGNDGTNGSGGGLGFGGAIYNDAGNITAVACTFSNNVVAGGFGGEGVVRLNGRGGNGGHGGHATGGAIYNNGGAVFLTNCVFTANSATGGTAGDGANALAGSNGNGGDGGNGGSAGGGAIYNSATGSLVVYDCTFTSNTVAGAAAGLNGFGSGGLGSDGANGFPGAGNSGAIYNDGGSLNVAFTTFNGNSAAGADGGAGADGPLDDDGINGRSGSSANGGGIFNNGGTVALTNCTLAANSAKGGDGGDGGKGGTVGFAGDGGNGGAGGPGNGGGVHNASGGTVLIVNCTFSLNQSKGGTGGSGGAAGSTFTRPGQTGGLGANYGGAIGNGGGSVTLKNTILAYGSPGTNAAGTILDGGNNLSSDATPVFTSPASRANTDPLLGPLINNNGPTHTVALGANSPAIDQGNDAACPPADQRHLARFGQSDIGAFEFNARSPTLHIVRQDNELIISWPSAFDYTLQSTPTLALPAWTSVTNARGVASFEYVVTNSLDGFNRFYRLRQ